MLNDNRLDFTANSFLYGLTEISPKIKSKIEEQANSQQLDIIKRAYKIANAINGSEGAELPKKLTQCAAVFNILNGNDQSKRYTAKALSEEPNYPSETNDDINQDKASFVIKRIEDIVCCDSPLDRNKLNNLVWFCRCELINIAPDTQSNDLKDISLYDLMKMTCAFSQCLKAYYKEPQNISDDDKAFLVYSIDISGIQNFIYNISSKGALKGLRARSFYLELLFEYVIDTLLKKLDLSRCNVLYVGGGHTYLILPNTQNTLAAMSDLLKQLNGDLISFYDNSLYAVSGYSQCSANELMNCPDGSYREVFARLSEMISSSKMSKYTSGDIRKLNRNKERDHSRECVVCKRLTAVNSKGVCSLCSSLEQLSDSIISRETQFAVVNKDYESSGLDLPFGKKLIAVTKQRAESLINSGQAELVYTKNQTYTDDSLGINLLVGDYVSDNSFSKLVGNSEGIKRLAVIRADVDNLGQCFVNGFKQTQNGKYENITRTSIFSRKLSEYFKYHINYLLKNPKFRINDDDNCSQRNAAIVYSGGDDLFIVGSWDDIIGFSVDLNDSLAKFAQGTITLSAGIGLYPEKYPLASMAEQTGDLESISKEYDGKNAVTLFDASGTYHWDDLVKRVIGEKLAVIKEFIHSQESKGNSLLYNMLDLIRQKNESDRLNIARFAYLLARNRPKSTDDRIITHHMELEHKLYDWIQNDSDCAELTTAIYIYVYMNRGNVTNENQ